MQLNLAARKEKNKIIPGTMTFEQHPSNLCITALI